MRGLLVKDWRLLKNQKQFFLSILLVSTICMASGKNLYFVISYCTLMASYFALSTVTYDEYNNGFFYLFTMPVSRRGYAVEKYLFSLIAGSVTWIAVTSVSGVYMLAQMPGTNIAEWLIGAAAEFFVLESMCMVLLPVQLKFGAGTSRIATMIVSLGIFGGVMLAAKAVKSTNIDLNFARLSEISAAAWFLIGLFGFLVVTLISMAVSIRIMERKQF